VRNQVSHPHKEKVEFRLCILSVKLLERSRTADFEINGTECSVNLSAFNFFVNPNFDTAFPKYLLQCVSHRGEYYWRTLLTYGIAWIMEIVRRENIQQKASNKKNSMCWNLGGVSKRLRVTLRETQTCSFWVTVSPSKRARLE